jgi:hypothetical protein
VRGRPLAMDETRPSKEQRARAYGKDLRRPSRLAAQPAENLFILHQGLLTRPARNVQDVQLRRFRQRRVRHDAQPHHVAHRVARLGIDAVGRVGKAREHYERAGEVDLVEILEQERADVSGEHFRES